MADPFSVAGSAVGVISLGIQACQSLVQYYGSWKDAQSNVGKMSASVTALVPMLKLLRVVLEEEHFAGDVRTAVEDSVKNVSTAVKELNIELHKFRGIKAITFRDRIYEQGRRLQYPFQEGTIFKLRDILSDLRASLLVAINILQL
jgi:ankyrin repeat domain-containing protein 50